MAGAYCEFKDMHCTDPYYAVTFGGYISNLYEEDLPTEVKDHVKANMRKTLPVSSWDKVKWLFLPEYTSSSDPLRRRGYYGWVLR